MKIAGDNPADLVNEWHEWWADYLAVIHKGEELNLSLNWPDQAYPDPDLIHKTSDHHHYGMSAPEMETALLVRWYRWWTTTDQSPNKLPESLHVRTALYLYQAGKFVPGTMEVLD